MKTLASNLKILQKEVLRERKESKKKESKIKKKSDKKKNPSGFAKPAPISADLASFLGLSPTDTIARTDVTSKVIAYVKEHNLQNPENKKQIIPDAKLKALLQPGESEVNFFNLQTHLKKHFPQTTTTTVEASVV
jgi:chromatin remodeling complex protein RSC6